MKPTLGRVMHFSDTGHDLWVADEFTDAAKATGLDRRAGFDAALRHAKTIPGGRTEQLRLEHPAWPGPIRLRRAARGGWLARWLGDLHGSAHRGRKELERWLALEQESLPVARAAFCWRRRKGLGWQHGFASLELEGARDGVAMLTKEPVKQHRIEAARALGRALRRMHDAGVIHGDLHPGNVLFRSHAASDPAPGGDQATLDCLFIDLDHTRLGSPATPTARMREWMRLERALEKRGVPAEERRRLSVAGLASYCAGDRTLRSQLLQRLPSEKRRTARHRWGWRVARQLSRARRPAAVLAFFCLLAGTIPGCRDATEPGRSDGPSQEIRLSLFAVGDTGRTRAWARLFEGQLAVAQGMVREDERRPVDGLIFLGDNFYWHGLDRAHLVERIRQNLVRPYCRFLAMDGPRGAEVASACPLPAARRRPVPSYAVLGNHDLELPESATLQREAIPQFLPGWQMSGGLAEVIELPHGVSLVLFESEIAIDDPLAIQTALHDALRRSHGPWRILATHRPIATDDRGFPQVGGYPAFVHDALASSGRRVQLALTAHHHNLQVFELTQPSPLLHVGVGAGSRAEPPLAQDHPDARFGRIQLGFARVDLIDGESGPRLAATLYGTPRWPWLALGREPEVLTRYEVDLEGRVFPTEPLDSQ